MSNTKRDRVRSYESSDIVVQYDLRRCIHAEECVHGIPGVFDRNRRPWVDPTRDSPDVIAEVIERCPTGALSYQRRDGGVPEAAPDSNRVTIAAGGPLYVHGDLDIHLSDGRVVRETRVALCRCGASNNKPFCDNSHLEIGFADPGSIGEGHLGDAPQEYAGLTIEPRPNGSIRIEGAVELWGAAGEGPLTGSRGSLCRCGGSQRKPFCDGTHKTNGFEAE